MNTSKKIYAFKMGTTDGGQVVLTAQDWPWCVLQVVPVAPAHFAAAVEKLRRHGFVAYHDTDRTFAIIHLASGDHDGVHPERHITISSHDDVRQYLDALKDVMAQAAVWYYANVIAAPVL